MTNQRLTLNLKQQMESEVSNPKALGTYKLNTFLFLLQDLSPCQQMKVICLSYSYLKKKMQITLPPPTHTGIFSEPGSSDSIRLSFSIEP